MERFSAKVAGLPVWAWSLILGLLLVAAMYWYRSRQTAASAAVAGSTGNAGLDALLGDGTGLTPSPSSGVGDPTASDGTSLGEFLSNTTWESQGVAYLVGMGQSPIAAQTALEQYLNGNPLTQAQTDLANTWIARKGLPPNGTLGLSELINSATGRTPSQQQEWDTNQAALLAQAAQDAANQTPAAVAVADPPVSAPAPAPVDRTADINTWLYNLAHHSWVAGPAEQAVIDQYGFTAQAATAKNNYNIAQHYYANFHRPAGWTGPNAVAAKQWLAANGYPAP